MNDLDLVRAVLDEVPEPPPARLAAGRARLLAAGAEPVAKRTPGRRLLLPAGVTAVAAAVAAVLTITLTSGPVAKPADAGHARPVHPGPAQPASLVARVLGTAARTVAAEPLTEPENGQWFYSRTIDTQTGQPTQTDEEWITFDSTKSAYHGPGGQLIIHTETGAPTIPPGTGALAAFDDNTTPLTSYNALAALPETPPALLAAVAAELARTGETNFGQVAATALPQREFAWLSGALWNAYAAAPPAALAAVYRAIATIPGVTVDQQATDAAGRPAIGITDDRGQYELLLSPSTYQPVGEITRNPAIKVKKGNGAAKTLPPQTESIAYLQISEVSAPGQR